MARAGMIAVMVLLIPLFGGLGGIDTGIADPVAIWMTNIITFLIASVLAIVTWAIALKQFNRDHLVSLV